MGRSVRWIASYPRVKAKTPTCHPDRPHLAKGLCAACYDKLKYANKRRGLPRRARGLKELYGLSLEAYDTMLKRQGGVCAICQQAPTGGRNGTYLHVDHDHQTGHIRGLLCAKCNTAIGQLKDDPVLLSRAIAYLGG